MADQAPFAAVLASFAAELRSAGLAVGTGDVLTYCTAMSTLDPADLVDLYWAGRATLVTRKDSIPTYDATFRRFFLGGGGPVRELLTLKAQVTTQAEAVLEVPATDPAGDGHAGGGHPRPDGLRRRGPPAQVVHRLHPRGTGRPAPDHGPDPADPAPPPHPADRGRGRRAVPGPAPDGPRLDAHARRAARAELAAAEGQTAAADPDPRRVRVDGRLLAQPAPVRLLGPAGRGGATRVEVFCFGTRLTRVTRALDRRRPDDALQQAAAAVFDWEGGTRIGASLDTFVRDWGRRGLARGGIVVICSDGLDRGDPAVLATAMDRLSRLCYRVVWMNPHKGDHPDFRPSTLGMMVAAPHVDLMLSGHDLASLEELATLLPTLS